MENTNQDTAQTPGDQVTDVSPQTPVQKPGLFDKVLKPLLSKLKPPSQVVSSQSPAPEVSDKQPVMPKVSPAVLKKVLIIAGVLIVVLLLLSVIVRMLPKGGPAVVPTAIPSLTPTPTPQSTIGRPSPYSNDPEIANAKQELDILDALLNQATFREDILRISQLDWSVNFEK